MSEPKFTPGPWFAGIHEDTGEIGIVAGDRGIAKVFDSRGVVMPIPVDEALANSLLIAAAPDLYAACQEFVELFQDSDMRPEDECHELYHKIAAALAKADGQEDRG